jgi:hypothetical protein
MSHLAAAPRVNPWKWSTFLLLGTLAAVVSLDGVSVAEAAGPLRLGKALSALKSSKKLLEDAKDPPSPFHQQSMMLVTQAIGAVEREIKAYEATQGKKGDGKDKPDAKAKKPSDTKDAPAKKKSASNESEE